MGRLVLLKSVHLVQQSPDMTTSIHKIPWFWRLVLAFVVSSLLFIMISIFSRFKEPPKFNLFLNALLLAMVFVSLEIVRWVQRRMLYRTKGDSSIARQSLVFTYSVLLGTLVYTLLFYFFKWLDHLVFYSEPPMLQHMVSAALIGLILCVIFGLFFLLLHWKDRYYSSYIRNEAFKKEITAANLHMLRNQLDPHFMFNNFNTLYYLIDEDKILAKRFLNNVSGIYRHVLQNTRDHLIPVVEEFKVVKQYLEVLKERYGNGLLIKDLVVEKHLDGKFIPPLVLQEIIENIFKHNQINEQHPISVQFVSNTGSLRIWNTVRPKPNATSHNTGLQNVIRRYDLLTEAAVVVDVFDDQFSVTIPLIEQAYEH